MYLSPLCTFTRRTFPATIFCMHWTLKRFLSRAAGAGLFFAIVAYAYFKSTAILEGPHITLTSPLSGMTATSSFIEVSGAVRHAKEITLDGRPIFIDLEGRFVEKLLLSNGYNIIELTARDVQGREERKTVEVVYLK